MLCWWQQKQVEWFQGHSYFERIISNVYCGLLVTTVNAVQP
jgi:hypothetical protein